MKVAWNKVEIVCSPITTGRDILPTICLALHVRGFDVRAYMTDEEAIELVKEIQGGIIQNRHLEKSEDIESETLMAQARELD